MDLQNLKIERKPPAKPRRRSPWLLRLFGLTVAGIAAWLVWPWTAGFVDRLRLPQVRTHVVSEVAAAAAAAVRGTAANGYIVAARRAALSSDVPGRIVELRVREGSVVKQGDVVARLFADEYRAALQRAVADVGTANAGVARAEAAQRAAVAVIAEAEANQTSAEARVKAGRVLHVFHEAELARLSALLRTGIGSQSDIDRAVADRDGAAARIDELVAAVRASATATTSAKERLAVAAADLAVAAAQAESAEAQRRLAQATLDKTDVRAPFDGIVVLKDAEVGEVVSPNVQGGSTARGAVCTLVDFDSLEVQANVPETTLSSVRVGAAADVFLDAFPDERYEGVVDRIWPTADRQKATVEVRVRLVQKDQRLRPEMGVRIVFRQDDEPVAIGDQVAVRRIVVPTEAIVLVDGKPGAFVLERDTVRFATVAIGEQKGGRVAINAGLTANQTIVLDPPASLQPGDRVRLADK